MKSSTNSRKMTAAFALVLLMINAFALMVIPLRAQEDGDLEEQGAGSIPLPAGVTADFTVKTTAYLSFIPNPVGVNQPILVNMWLTPALHRSRYLAGFKVTITDPDGNEEVRTMNSYHADATAWFEYNVDQVGTWTLKFEFPGGYFPAGIYIDPSNNREVEFPESCYYEPASTAEQELTVQEEMVISWPPSPLPKDYWTRPIPIDNREWWEIGGNFPWTGIGGGPNWPADTNIYPNPDYDFTPWVQAPNTAHIAWRRLGNLAGIIGGQTYIAPHHPEACSPTKPDIIFVGRGYQALSRAVNGEPTGVWQCYDIRTGEVYWEQTVPAIIRTRFGALQVSVSAPIPNLISYYEAGPAVPGATQKATQSASLLYIGGGRLIKYDAYTGALTTNVTIAPLSSGQFYADPYALTVQNLGGGNYRLINWTTAGSTQNFADRVMSNISWPWSNLGDSQDFESMIAFDVNAISPPSVQAWVSLEVRAADLITGIELWNKTIDNDTYFSSSTAVADHGKGAVAMNDGYWLCWNLRTGNQEWKSEVTDYPWGIWWPYSVASAYGMIFDGSYAGVYAFDWDTGKIVWNYKYATPYAYETPYGGEYSFRSSQIIADGKIYEYNTEHSPTAPLTRGWKLHCIDAFTGKGIWNITGSMSPGPVADGYLTAANVYDGYMYVFGKGKSQTTVNASPKTIANGTNVLIEGTVLDMSPAQPGTPCVSKESMATYMEYLHMQKPIPDGHTVTGVPVLLLAFDPEDNVIEIGETTSDMSGKFAFAWTPPDEGLYKITASFLGDDSYGSSWDETAVIVGPAPAENGSIEPGPTGAFALTTTEIALVAALAIVIVLAIGAFWALIRRK